tara:strand:+ start:244 stop:639 length:396 start_codon:yes stop_codon:yes gene_type:complete
MPELEQGISIKLPLSFDGHNGKYRMNKTYRDVVKQNFKHMILTNPGERIMDPDFGSGIRRLLFELDEESLQSEIVARIHEQVSMYMPYISIINISFTSPEFNIDSGPYTLSIRLDYQVTSLEIADFLDIEV